MKKNQEKTKTLKLERRRARARARIAGTKERPRFSVFRSAKHLQLQLIDDEKQRTLLHLTDSRSSSGKKSEGAFKLGEEFGRQALSKGIKKAVFDKGGRAYHGRIKAVADGARKAGLAF